MGQEPKKWWLKTAFGVHSSDFEKQEHNLDLAQLKKTKSGLMGESALTTPANSMRAMWDIIRPYWQSEDKKNAWLKTGAIVAMTLSMVGLDLAINYTLMDFYKGIQKYDSDLAIQSLTWFGGYALSWVALKGLNQYVSRTLQMDWRNWLSNQFTDAVMDKKALSRIKSDNIDQRIAEDLNIMPEKTLALITGAALAGGMGILEAGATFVGFVGMMIDVSPKMAIDILDHTFNVPYLLPIAFAYAGLGTAGAHMIGKALNKLNFVKQQREGDYRHAWSHIRQSANEIGLADGEEAERVILDDRLDKVKGNCYALARAEKKVTWYSATYSQLAVILPYTAALPAYFAKEIDLGGLRGIAGAFGSIRHSLSLIIESYPTFAECKASFNRIGGLRKNIVQEHKRFDEKNTPLAPVVPGGPS